MLFIFADTYKNYFPSQPNNHNIQSENMHKIIFKIVDLM